MGGAPFRRGWGLSNLDLAITDEEIAATLKPFVVEQFAPNDPTWMMLAKRNARLQRRRRLTRCLLGWLPPMRRRQASIQIAYSLQWAERRLELELSGKGPTVPCLWRGAGMRARAIATTRVHLLYLMRVIARLRPANVLEVGCGDGLNLFVLAARFPDVRFTGVELTLGGVAASNELRAEAELPKAVWTFAPEPLVDPKPFDRIRVVRGNAAVLPFANRSFDLVFTRLALEQMEEIRISALTEIERVARAYTAMVEPFREWNDTGPERDYIVANDYFAGRIAELPRFGLTPVSVVADMPSKLTFRVGLVVCQVR